MRSNWNTNPRVAPLNPLWAGPIHQGTLEKQLYDDFQPPLQTPGPEITEFARVRLCEAEGWRTLRDALIDHPVSNPVHKTSSTDYRTKNEVVCSLRTPDRRNPCIVTIWQLASGGRAPVLVAAYPD